MPDVTTQHTTTAEPDVSHPSPTSPAQGSAQDPLREFTAQTRQPDSVVRVVDLNLE